jgi:hypothetical protein
MKRPYIPIRGALHLVLEMKEMVSARIDRAPRVRALRSATRTQTRPRRLDTRAPTAPRLQATPGCVRDDCLRRVRCVCRSRLVCSDRGVEARPPLHPDLYAVLARRLNTHAPTKGPAPTTGSLYTSHSTRSSYTPLVGPPCPHAFSSPSLPLPLLSLPLKFSLSLSLSIYLSIYLYLSLSLSPPPPLSLSLSLSVSFSLSLSPPPGS